MDKQALIKKIIICTKDGKISCKEAQTIADKEGIPYNEIGMLLNELKIKIANCQLSCFP